MDETNVQPRSRHSSPTHTHCASRARTHDANSRLPRASVTVIRRQTLFLIRRSDREIARQPGAPLAFPLSLSPSLCPALSPSTAGQGAHLKDVSQAQSGSRQRRGLASHSHCAVASGRRRCCTRHPSGCTARGLLHLVQQPLHARRQRLWSTLLAAALGSGRHFRLVVMREKLNFFCFPLVPNRLCPPEILMICSLEQINGNADGKRHKSQETIMNTRAGIRKRRNKTPSYAPRQHRATRQNCMPPARQIFLKTAP